MCFEKYCREEQLETSIIKEAYTRLNEYFSGKRKQFEIELEYQGTDFQLSVLEQLKKIPYGKTRTYQEIACNIGNPKSAVAVGQACGRNPIPIFIPCHRVIGANGSLVGYNGGISIKKKLLEIERCSCLTTLRILGHPDF
ncbi:MAG: methylated-DNA--[protein]-cysteine S-methyltransferase [Holosporaceae bacterium]|nr:methylated-DNA--[protein]-cysteine S-methyltransferase [Holosporaceae bacterium]